MGHENLKARTKTFALDVVCLCAGIPRVAETSHVRGQLQRCATSVAANYRAACRARSKPDFIAKLGIVEEEADESAFWLELLKDVDANRDLKLAARLSQELERLLDEANQLVAITVPSRKTARENFG
jgi:four helix bundle protein